MFEGGDDDADGEDTQDCENLLVEVLERQGAADEEVNFGTFRDVDGDVTTSPDFTDSDIVAAVAPRPASSESEEDSDVEVDDGPLTIRSGASCGSDASLRREARPDEQTGHWSC
ncbi:hypothetical protein MTO96_049273 [Rhipicephalus appendiculatus]